MQVAVNLAECLLRSRRFDEALTYTEKVIAEAEASVGMLSSDVSNAQ